MFESGIDRSWLEPAQRYEDGSGDRTLPSQIGSYSGMHSHLNVSNPQPGRHYFWIDTANTGNVTRHTSCGATLVLSSEPEGRLSNGLPKSSQVVGQGRSLGLEGYVSAGQLVLAWYPVEHIAEQRRIRAETVRAKLTAAEETYANEGVQRHAQLAAVGRASQSGHAYYKHAKHSLELDDISVPAR